MNLRFTFLLFVAAIAGLISCKNNDNVFPVQNLGGRFKIVNASSNSINYFLNGTRLNNGTSLNPGNSTLYIITPLGSQNFQFKLSDSPDLLFSWPEKVDSLNHTLYITGNSADKAFRTTDVLNVDTGFVSLSFVNAAPDAGNLDVKIGDTLRFAASAFKSQSPFVPVASGQRDIKVYKAGTATLLKDTTLTINQNQVYTIYSYGVPGGTGNSKFGIGLTLNL